MPVGHCREREFSMICAVLMHEAATTTAFA